MLPPGGSKSGTALWLTLALVGGVVLLVGIVGAVSVFGGDPSDQGPTVQQEFVSIVKMGQDAADDNEIAVVKARKERASALCAALPDSLKATDWVGVVDDVETTLGGDSGVLDIKLANGINVTTWNNAASDLGDDTLISPDSALYDQLDDLDRGDAITFSGQFIDGGEDCIREQSLFDVNGMRTPAFVMKFSDLSRR